MTIKLLITGGTIDKVYNELTGQLVFKQTHLIDILNQSRSMVDTLPEVLFLKDSLDMRDVDRALILQKCQTSNINHILITHGTDTMVETAKLLGQEVNNKTIVLFGAMMPYSINSSDALFNLGVALSAVQTKECGVYIAMNGQVFDFDKVEKNKGQGIFTSA